MRTPFAPRLLLIGLLASSIPVHLSAQSQGLGTPSQDLEFELISPEGALGTFVTGIAQDRQGFIWIAAGDNIYAGSGLYKYDGYRTTIYRHDATDSTSLSHERLECLYVDREGILWVGTWGGLNRFDPIEERFIHYRTDPGDPGSLSHDAVTVVLEDHEGMLWVGTHSGLNRLDRETGTFTRYRHDPNDPNTLSDDHVRALHEDSRGVLWVGTGSAFASESAPGAGGLNRLDRKTGTFMRFLHDPEDPASLISNRVQALFEDSRGSFWVGTQGNVLHKMDREAGDFERYAYDPKRPGRLSRPERSSNEPSCVVWDCGLITFIDEDRSGTLWIGAFGQGLLQYDSKTGVVRHHETDPDDPNSLNVWRIYQSRDGTLWVGTWAGLNKLVAPAVTLPGYELPGLNGRVYSLIEDHTGALWLATGGGGLFRFDRASGVFTNYRHDPDDPTSLGGGAVDVVYEDREGVLWVGTHGGGLCRFDRDTETFTRYENDPADPASLSENVVHDVYEDRSGRMWIGTTGGLNLFERRTGTFTRYLHVPDDPKSLNSNNVRDIVDDRDGRLWVATNRGLNLLDESTGRYSHYQHEPGNPNSLVSSDVTALRGDRNGGLWIGTDKGLDHFDPALDTFAHFTPANSGLPARIIPGILLDDRGDPWIAGAAASSVMRLNPRQQTVHTYENHATVAFWTGSEDAFFKTKRGEFLIGRENGFYAFFPDALEEQVNPHPPEVVLTGFRLLDHPVEPGEGSPLREPIEAAEAVTLAHDQNVFSFEYVGLHYVDPAQNGYMHILEGYDEAWRDAGPQRTARYYKVPPGKYLFRVKASNSDGIWNEEGASIRVVVLPPWWRTPWANVAYVLLFLGGVFAVNRFQRRRLIRREREKAHERELKQARELEKAYGELESVNARMKVHEERLEAQALRLQALDEMKSRFFANISHEFRTPLMLILGPIDDLLRDGGTLDNRTLDGMRRSARRLLRLIDELLALARLEFGSMTLQARRIDVVASIRSMVLAFAARAEREEITLSFLSSTERIDGYLDLHKLETIITNLLSNAFRYTPGGGKIGVSVGMDAEDDGPYATIVVRDTGEGIPPGELPYVFDRFYQGNRGASRRRDGLGLGLALSKELVELHGGTLRVESQVGFGTTFIVSLPTGGEHLRAGDVIKDAAELTAARTVDIVSIEADGPPAEEDAEEEEVAAIGAADPLVDSSDAELVLIVEDNSDLRAHLRSRLSGAYAVIEACDGVEGLALARQQEPALVIADVMMPNMDGLALCRAIKEDPALDHIPVVLLTARAAEEDLIEGLQTGADDYLTKPFSTEELLLRLENLIEVRRHLRERFSDEVVIRPSQAVVSSEAAAFLERVRQVIEERMSESSFGVGELAAELNMSTRQLQRLMKEGAALSASGCIRMMRMERAAQLLEQEAGRVSEIASAVGYSDAKHFSRRFRQVFGVLPSEFGRQTRQEG
jgi:signal transduction histidine kinase/ligand-binding sensor domain-containing protein/DNA-binding response OmpR family regulator